jgi:hypothetical protein
MLRTDVLLSFRGRSLTLRRVVLVVVAEPPTFDVDGLNQDGGRPGSEGLGNGR